MTSEQVRVVLLPLAAALWNIVETAFSMTMDCQAVHALRNPNPIRSMMHDFMNQLAMGLLPDKYGVLAREKDQTAFFFWRGVTFRFKKVDRAGMCTDNPTKQTDLFNGQQPWLLGLPKQTNVYIGYVLGRLETGIEAVKIVRRDGDTVLWSFDLERLDNVKNFSTYTPGSEGAPGTTPNADNGRKHLKIVPKNTKS